MKRLRSVENDQVQLEIGVCDCGYHFGIDATFLDQVTDFIFECPACGRKIDTGELFKEEPEVKEIPAEAVVINTPPPERPAVPEDFICPGCGADSAHYGEYVLRMIPFKEIRNGVVFFEPAFDEVNWEDSKDGRLFCRVCGHEWPVPPGVKIDFE